MADYLVVMLTYVGFFMILSLALNLQWGMTGLVNFGVAGFYGIGAYASGILSTRLGWPVGVTVLLGGGVAAAFGTLVALLAMRLRGDYFAIVTLGFSEVARLVMLNEDWLTEGPRGLKVSARPFASWFSGEAYPLAYLVLVALVVALVFAIVELLRRSPYGRVLRAIRDDDVVAGALGKNVLRFRVQAFALGSAFMGVAGALFCHYVQNISPDSFLPMLSIFIWMSVIVGGAGNNKGLLLGAGVVMTILEGTRFLNDFVHVFNAETLASIRIIAIGVLLIVVLRFRPRGLIPEAVYRYAPARAKFPNALPSAAGAADPRRS